jgi:site-specific recombinase XerD
MTVSLTRTGDLVTLDAFHIDLLAAMLDEEVPHILTVGQVKTLVQRVRAASNQGMRYSPLLEGLLVELDRLLA